MKVLIVLNSAWNLLNFRAGLIKALIAQGHEVVLAAPTDENVPALEELGAKFINLPMRAHGLNPIADLRLFLRLLLLLNNIKPMVLLTYTAKPNIYGGLAGRLVSIPVINNIAGLGSVFIKNGWVARLLTILYRLALTRSKRVFFQNNDDRVLFIKMGMVKTERTSLLPGSGVDLCHFALTPLPCLKENHLPFNERKFIFLLIARLLKDKGILEYAEAARLLKPLYPRAEFALLGFHDKENPNAISEKILNDWSTKGILNYWGSSKDVRNEIATADCVVLPSYREGTPRSLLEAAAMGRPLIATDVPGCREVVRPNFNGLICEPCNEKSLAMQMENMLLMQPDNFMQMAQASRKIAQEKFDEHFVIDAYTHVLNNI